MHRFWASLQNVKLTVDAVEAQPEPTNLDGDGLANGKDPFAAFNGHGASFVDDVRSWQTDEPALDMTGAAIIASASQLAVHRWLG